MQSYPVLSVQDISCVGQCSLTVALPVLSALGHECAILPTSLLSSHTAFSHTTLCNLEKEIPSIFDAWRAEEIRFSGIYLGYIGSVPAIKALHRIFSEFLIEGAPIILDPVLGDNGELYRHFDKSYVDAIRDLLPYADVILPNLTEACLLADMPFCPSPDANMLALLHSSLQGLGARSSVITGIHTSSDRIAISIDDGKTSMDYETPFIKRPSHGAGDVFASVVAGRIFADGKLADAAKEAADFTYEALCQTPDEHWYGLAFEPLLPKLITKK